MKLYSLSSFLLLAWSATAATAPAAGRDYTSYVVTYNPDTPDSVVDQDIARAKENVCICLFACTYAFFIGIS